MKRNNTSVVTFLAICQVLQAMMAITAPAQPLNYKIVSGEWARTDGPYTLRVQNVTTDGSVDVNYFNPGEIHVAERRVSTQEGLIKLYVKLQDEGYPGCTYKLYYYAAEDALAGFYYQAAMDQTFEVIFLRKK